MKLRPQNPERIIMTLAIAAIVAAAYLLWDDSLLVGWEDKSDLPTIGKIIQPKLDVRKKRAKKFVWRKAKETDSMHAGDSLFTGNESSATVEFNDGSQIEIEPNSLIILGSNGDQMNLNLKFGNITGTLSSDANVQVQVRGDEVELKQEPGMSSKLKINSSGAIHILQGKIVPKSKRNIVKVDRKPVVISKVLTTTTLAPFLKIPKAPPPPIVEKYELVLQTLSPKNIVHTNRDIALSGKLQFQGKQQKFKIQFSSTADFATVLSEESSASPEFNLNSYPESGTYFVRVQGENDQGKIVATSAVEKIEISVLAAPAFTQPNNDFQLNLKPSLDGLLPTPNEIDFSWTYTKPAAYLLQISEDPEFKNVRLEYQPKGLSFKVTNLPNGSYYARVKDSSATKPWSANLRFSVSILSKDRLPAPLLLTKSVSVEVPTEKPINLAWKKVDGAAKYILELANNPEFSGAKQFPSTKTTVQLEEVKNGRQFYRVTAATQKGTRGAPSETGTILGKVKELELTQVTSQTEIGKDGDSVPLGKEFNLQWKNLKIAQSYLVEISKDSKFKDPVKAVVKTNSKAMLLKDPSKYFWRVKPLGIDGKDLAGFSSPSDFSYDFKIPFLSSPVLSEPFADVTLYFQKDEGANIWLEWKAVKQALSYQVEVALTPDFKTLLFKNTVATRRYLVRNKLPQGKLYWRVKALGEAGKNSTWSESRRMSVDFGRLPAGQ